MSARASPRSPRPSNSPARTSDILSALERTKPSACTGDAAPSRRCSAIAAPGHTPGHQCVLIVSGDEHAILWGDLAVHPAQLAEPDWRFAADMDADAARRTRHRLLDRIEAEGMMVAARHFPAPGFGQLVRLDGRRSWHGL